MLSKHSLLLNMLVEHVNQAELNNKFISRIKLVFHF